ncbi:MAG: hypothetical protein U1F57_09100 [bacterium]
MASLRRFDASNPGETCLDRFSRDISSRLSPLQADVDHLLDGFIDQACDWKSLTAFMAGGAAFSAGKAGSALAVGKILRTSPAFFQAATFLGGLAAETSAFEVSRRSLASLTGESDSSSLWRWKGEGGLAQGWLSSFFTFGFLKGAGFVVASQNAATRHFFQSTAMVLGNQWVSAFGWVAPPSGSFAEQWLHAETTLLQMGAAMNLIHLGGGGRVFAFERSLELSVRAVSEPSLFQKSSFLSFRPAEDLAAEGERGRVSFEKNSFLEKSSVVLMSSHDEGEGGGGGSSVGSKPFSTPRIKVVSKIPPGGDKPIDFASLTKAARRNRKGALETLTALAEENHFGAINALGQVAEKNLQGIWILIRLAENENFAAKLKVKSLELHGYRRGDPSLGKRAPALIRLAEMGNKQAVDLFIQALWVNRQSLSLDVLEALAKKNYTLALRGIAETAAKNPRAVQVLHRLAEDGNRAAADLLKNVAARYFSSLLWMEVEEVVEPLLLLSRHGNGEAFKGLKRAARIFPSAVRALLELAQEGRSDAIQALRDLVESPAIDASREARIALETLAGMGQEEAVQVLERLSPRLTPTIASHRLTRLWRWFRRFRRDRSS